MESVVTLADLQKFYSGKKIFLTGHTGFKGTWLMAFLHKLGASVKGYALAPEESKPFHDLFKGLIPVESVFADIRDRQRVAAEILSFKPDIVFHLAAQPLVIRSYEIPSETFEVNVVGTANLLEGASKLENKCAVVVVTTDKVYENKEQDILYKENDTLGGFDPYSASKACTELVVSSFRKSFFNPDKYAIHQKSLASARAGNVIGGGDWSKNRIIPDTATALINNAPVAVRNPAAVRPWQHVLEPLGGYLLLAARLYEQPGKYSRPFNFGPFPEDHLTVKELVDLAIQTWGGGTAQFSPVDNAHHEASLLKLDINDAIKVLEWSPKLQAAAAIRWTMEWYRKEADKKAAFTFEQIDNYLAQ